VGDRGMLTNARIRDEIRPAQLEWISALRAPQIKALVDDGALQLSLFDTQDLVEIDSPHFPGERLVCCHNPVLAAGRARKRGELLAATEKELAPIAAATRREKRPLRGRDRIALRVGKVINHYKMAKHFTLEITDESFTFTRNTEDIAAEAALDGIYVLRTSLPTDSLPTDDVPIRWTAPWWLFTRATPLPLPTATRRRSRCTRAAKDEPSRCNRPLAHCVWRRNAAERRLQRSDMRHNRFRCLPVSVKSAPSSRRD
jgi:hypothetical protein